MFAIFISLSTKPRRYGMDKILFSGILFMLSGCIVSPPDKGDASISADAAIEEDAGEVSECERIREQGVNCGLEYLPGILREDPPDCVGIIVSDLPDTPEDWDCILAECALATRNNPLVAGEPLNCAYDADSACACVDFTTEIASFRGRVICAETFCGPRPQP